MRAVIMDIKDKHVIVMTRDGQFKKIKKPHENMEIGMEITFAEGVQHNIRRIAAILVIVIFMSGFGVSAYAYYTPYGYVNLDINPNIEIIYNRFNRVLKMNGLNEDGENLVKSMTHYKYTKVEDTMRQIINQTIDEEHLEESHVLITYDHINKQTLDLVKETLEDEGHVDVYTIKMPTHDYEDAKNEGKSLGKAILIKDIMENHPDYQPKELEQQSIATLIEIAEDNAEKEKEKINEETVNEKQNRKQKESKPKEKIKKDNQRFHKNENEQQIEKGSKDGIKDDLEDELKEKDESDRRNKRFDNGDDDDKDEEAFIQHKNKKSMKDSHDKERLEERKKDKEESKQVNKKDKRDKEDREDNENDEDSKKDRQYNDDNKDDKNEDDRKEDDNEEDKSDNEDDENIKRRDNKGHKRNIQNKPRDQQKDNRTKNSNMKKNK